MNASCTFAQAYDLLKRYGYPSLVVIFSCIVLFGNFRNDLSGLFRWLLGWSLYLCVSSRMYSASYYFLGFATCSVVLYFVIEYLPGNIQILLGENYYLYNVISFLVIIAITYSIRFTIFRKFTISSMQLFVSSMAMFFLKEAVAGFWWIFFAMNG